MFLFGSYFFLPHRLRFRAFIIINRPHFAVLVVIMMNSSSGLSGGSGPDHRLLQKKSHHIRCVSEGTVLGGTSGRGDFFSERIFAF